MKLSVCIPTRNRPEQCAHAVQSVLDQTHRDWELILYDVGSIHPNIPTHPRIRRYQGENRGPAADFQAAIDLATGDVVTPLADDDTITPYALETVAAQLGDKQWLIGRTVIVNEHGDPLHLRGGTIEDVEDTMNGSYMLGGGVYWRREFGRQVGGFNSNFDGAADFDLYRRMILAAPPALSRSVLYINVDHPQTDSRVNAERQADAAGRIAAR